MSMNRFTICNLTDDTVVIQREDFDNEKLVLSPSKHISIAAPVNARSRRRHGRDEILVHRSEATGPGDAFSLRHLRFRKTWRLFRHGSYWLVYSRRIRSMTFEVVVLSNRDLSAFLSDMPDSLPLSSLMLPGTHDSMAFYGWVFSQCQSADTPLAVQLESGIRVIDIRLALVNSQLITYHGLYPQRASFQDILATIHTFLTSPRSSRETIVMSIKQEDYNKTPPPIFSACVHEEIFQGPGGRDMWFLDNRVPTLGEVRGKVIMFSRFGGNGDGWENGLEGLGIHPTTWPDSDKYGFSWSCKNTLVHTHDWYAIPSFLDIPEKVSLSTQNLVPPAPSDEPPVPILPITYFSAASFPLAMPITVACGFGWPDWGFGVEGVNSRVGKWLMKVLCSEASVVCSSHGTQVSLQMNEKHLDNDVKRLCVETRLRGWAFLDFYEYPLDNGIVSLLVECNYRGRRSGEEGWPKS